MNKEFSYLRVVRWNLVVTTLDLKGREERAVTRTQRKSGHKSMAA